MESLTYQKEILNYLNKDDFKNERHFNDYLEHNIELFCKQCLGVEYKSHVREYPLISIERKTKKVDFLVESMCGKSMLLECKTPKFISELHSAIGQLLSYGSLFKSNSGSLPDKLILASSTFDSNLIDVIKDFNLPITLVGLDKSNHLLHDISHLN
jgi:hypothetical protein